MSVDPSTLITPPPVPGGTAPDTQTPPNPLIPNPTPSVESEQATVITQLQAQVAALTAAVTAASNSQPVGAVQALTSAKGPSDPSITASQLEPGLKWAVQNGLVQVEDLVKKYGDHMATLFAEYVSKI